MAALDNIASELLKSANEADLNYKKTRDQAQRDKAVRLRKIVENLKLLTTNPTLDQVLTAGNTSTNTLDVGGITTDYVQLDTTATPTLQPGMFAWNDQDGTANLRLKGGNVTLQVGQETLARVVNKTGADLLESQYKVVRVRIASEGGSQGQRLAVVLAQGNNDPDSVTTLGIVTETILNNQEGFITIFGNVNGINTTGSLQGETWVDGDVLFLSPTTPGALTKVKPIAPNHTVVVGYVLYAHGVNGKIFVKVDNGYELDELHNVRITAVANNDLLQYDSVQQVWKNVAASVAVPTPTLAQVTTAGNTTTNAITVGSLTVATNLIYTDAVGGRVGIGTTGLIPGILLTINGSVSIAAGQSLKLDPSANIYMVAASSQFRLYTGSIAALSIPNTGNVLINTTTDAGYKLDVNGTSRITGNVIIGGVLEVASAFSTRGLSMNEAGNVHSYTAPATNRTISFVTNGFSFRLFPTGNFAIGSTTDVNAKFVVAGSITASSAIARGVYFNNTLVAAANNDVLVGLDINPTFTNGAFTGVSNIGLRVSGQVLFNAYGAYNTVTPTLRIENVDTNNVAIQIKGNVANYKYYWIYDSQTTEGIYKSDQARIDFYGGTNVGFAFRNNYGRLFTIVGTTGNVLINTTTDAGYKLDVNGIARVGDSGGSGQLYIKGFAGTGQYLYLDDGSKVWSLVGATNYSIQENGTSRLTIKEGGNVGIGTAAPLKPLHINTNNNDSSLSFRISNELAAGRAGLSFNLPNNANEFYSIGIDNDRFLKIANGINLATNTRVAISPSGNVLIGTTTDAGFKLDVNGDIRSTRLYANVIRDSNGNNIVSTSVLNITNTDTTVGTGTTNTLTLSTKSLTGVVYVPNGNVGIGTSSPTDKLHIVDNTNGNKFARISAGGTDASAAWVAQNDQVDNVVYRVFGSAVTGSQMGQALARSASLIANLGGTGKFLIGSYSGTDLIFGTSDQARMRLVDATGNFLIGTMTDTGNKLTVSGDIDAQGYKINNVIGYTGILNIPTNPPGQQNVDIQSGIVVNIF